MIKVSDYIAEFLADHGVGAGLHAGFADGADRFALLHRQRIDAGDLLFDQISPFAAHYAHLLLPGCHHLLDVAVHGIDDSALGRQGRIHIVPVEGGVFLGQRVIDVL